MKRHLVFAIGLLLSIFMFAVPVPNGDFEGWNNYSNEKKIQQTTKETSHAGEKCLKHWRGTTQMYPPYIAVKPDTWYRIRLFCRVTAQSGEISFGIRQCVSTDKDTKSVKYNWFSVKLNVPEWREYVREFKTDPRTHGLSIYFRCNEILGGEAYYDDITIEEFVPEKKDVTMLPYHAGATFVEGENLVIQRLGKGPAKWRKLNLEQERLSIQLDESVKGAKVSVTIRGRYDGKNYFSKEVVNPQSSVVTVTLPLETLGVGRYVVRAELVGKPETGVENDLIRLPKMDYIQEKREPIQEVSWDKQGTLLVNGKPFFPVTYCHYDFNPATVDGMKSQLGMNTVVVWAELRSKFPKKPISEITDEEIADFYIQAYRKRNRELLAANLYGKDALGLRGIGIKAKGNVYNVAAAEKIARALGDDPGCYSLSVLDEPEIHKQSPDVMNEAYRKIKDAAPRRLVFTNLCNPSLFKEYSLCSDIASFDFYPIPEDSLLSFWTRLRQIKSAFPAGRPLQSYLQTYNPAGIRAPTFDELRTMMYMNMMAGGKFFTCYSFSERAPFQCILSNPELQNWTKATVAEYYRMRDFMTASEVLPVDFKFPNGVICAMAKSGNKGILIISNISGESQRLTWNLPASSCDVRFEGRKLQAADGNFTDLFRDTETHVYSFEVDR